MDLTQELALSLRSHEIEINHPETISEEELFRLVTEQVQYMIEHKMDYLLSLMYRLDIDEDKIQQALFDPMIPEPSEALARLIIDRQKQRIMTKNTIKVDKTDWSWDL